MSRVSTASAFGIFVVLACFLNYTLNALAATAEGDDLSARMNALYGQYLHGDVVTATRSMEQAVDILEKLTSAPFVKAHGLFLAHARLFCLAKADGQQTEAEIHYEKARYWYLVEMEDSGFKPERIMELLKLFDTSRCKTHVDKFDRANTGGRGPNWAPKKANPPGSLRLTNETTNTSASSSP